MDEGFRVLLPESSANGRYRVLVACRDAEPTGVDVGAGSMGHRCVSARVVFPAGEIGVIGLYVPSRGPKDRRNQDKRSFQDLIAAVLPNVQKVLDVSGSVVVAGDLNVLELDHDPRYAVFGEWEYDFYRAFCRVGFDDVFRLLEPIRMEYSWFVGSLPKASATDTGLITPSSARPTVARWLSVGMTIRCGQPD